MTANTDVNKLYEFVLQQMAAESYFEGIDFAIADIVKEVLRLGTNRVGYRPGPQDGFNQGWPGFTRMTDSMADEFWEKFEILHQWSDNPCIRSDGSLDAPRPPAEGDPLYPQLNDEILANTGFSATLIKNRETGEFTLSIRSTEFRQWEKGGDGQRDTFPTDVLGVSLVGFALAQLDAMEKYYQWLKDNKILKEGDKLNVTGYSLGGHLATVFTEIHKDDEDIHLEEAVTFNGAGRGEWDTGEGSIESAISYFHDVLINPAHGELDLLELPFYGVGGMVLGAELLLGLRNDALAMAESPQNDITLYNDPRYKWAVACTKLKFDLWPDPFGDGTTADSQITQVFGYETIQNLNVTANSQNNGQEVAVGIEDQPLTQVLGGVSGLAGDFGTGHSIVLIADSLVLQRVIYKLDSQWTLGKMLDFLPSVSKMVPSASLDVLNPNYEADALENILDGLRFAFEGPEVATTPYREGLDGFGDWDSRNTYHNNIKNLQESPAFQALLAPTDGAPSKVSLELSSYELNNFARTDFAAYVALRQLSPVVIRPTAGNTQLVNDALGAAWEDVYLNWDKDRELENGEVHEWVTDTWIQSRAAMLSWMLLANTKNLAVEPSGVVLIDDPRWGRDIWHFEDEKTDNKIYTVPLFSSKTHLVYFGDDESNVRILGSGISDDYLFGGDGADTLSGMAGNDYIEGNEGDDTLDGGYGRDFLYGLTGDDTLAGGKDTDRLAGGTGDDTYVIKLGDGIDTISDSDGKGTIKIDDISLSGGKKQGDSWLSEDGKFRYVMVTAADGTQKLQVFPIGSNTGPDVTLLYIEEFTNGNFNIQLEDAPESDPQQIRMILGDVRPFEFEETDSNGNTYTTYHYDDLGNLVGTSGSQQGPDMLLGSVGNDDMVGGEGNDTLYGSDGNDRLSGGAGADLIAGGLGVDSMVGGDGDDILYGDSIHSTVGLQAGTQVVRSDTPPPVPGATYEDSGIGWIRFQADVVNLPNADAVTLVLAQLSPTRFDSVRLTTADLTSYGQGMGGADVIDAGGGNDTVYGEAGDDNVQGGAGDDRLHGGSGADILAGGDDNDLLMGDGLVYATYRWNVLDLMGSYRTTPQTETYENEFGNDLIFGGAGDDYLFGMAGADILYGEAGNDYLVGDFFEVVNVPVMILSQDGNSFVLDTTEHFKEAVQYHGNDVLDGGAGDDYLVGLAGDDQLIGGAGADVLIADGNPIEVQDRYGNDYLDGGDDKDFLQGSGGSDELYGGTGDDELWGDEYAGTNAQPVTSWDGAPVNTSSSTSVLDVAKHGRDYLGGGEGNDTLTGGGFDDRLEGGAGNDFLFGDGIGITGDFEGKDILFGDAGDDQLQGNGNDDQLYGGEGLDKLYGQDGKDYVAGDAGDDYLEGGKGDDTLDGGDGIDTLWGNDDNDILIGGTGNDLITGGTGNDTITGGTGRDYQDGGDGNDTYVLKAGDGEIVDNTYEMIVDSSGSDTLRFEGVDPNAIIIHKGTSGTDVAIQYGTNDGVYIKGGLGGAIETVEFAGGATLTFGDFLVDHMVDPLSLTASSSGTGLFGGKGNDNLATLNVNTVFGGTGNDSITINGGGNTIFMRRGDGVDTISWGNGPSSPTRVRFDKGITPADLQIFPSGSSDWYRLNIRIDGNPNNALVFTGFSMNYPMDYKNAVGYFDFTNDDGSIYTLTYEEMLSGGFNYPFTEGADTVVGTSLNETFDGKSGNDYIRGGAGNDVLIGGAGNDSLGGGYGNDTLQGGIGDDYLSGGSGIDTYLFAKGDGIDSIDSFNDVGDVVSLAYNADELFFRNLGNDLIMSFLDSLDKVTVSQYFSGDGGGLSAGIDIVSADGVHYNYAATRAKALEATAGDDFIIGMDRNDTIVGLAGNDTLAGGLGDDTIDGGAGDDILALDAGDDTYVFGVGSGHDQIQTVNYVPTYNGVGSDTIFMSGLTASQVMATRISSSLMAIKVLASDDWISFSSSSAGFAGFKVRFADGTVWTSTDLNAKAPLSEGSDVLNLLDTNDELDVLGGNDTVNANGGDDTIWGNSGNDTLNGGVGNDSLHGGIGDDTLSGGVGQDYLVGDDGNDKLSGGDGDDWLYSGNGTDSMDGGDGWDTLVADTADGAKDTLTGGAGNDTYYVSESGDTAVEVDGGGYDIISYLGGGSYTIPLWVERIQYTSYGVSIKVTGNSQNNFFDVQYSTSKDTLIGGAGNDTYYYVDSADVITESKTGGVDTIYIRGTSYNLAGTNIENAVIVRPTGSVQTVQAWSLYGTSAANYLSIEDGFGLSAYGYDGNDTLEGAYSSSYGVYDYLDGGNGDDILNGRGGSGDTLVGGSGNDTYYVGSSERLIEAANAGTDTVIAHIDYSLSANFENLTLADYDTALRGTGNAVINKITGNSYDNVLDGGEGADSLIGGAGNDTLIGGIGIDTLSGGLGDDTFVVDSTSDVIQENVGEGNDSVQSSATYTLVANVDNLTLTGAGTINGTGNALANRLRGNSASNILTGLAGNDTYLFGRGGGADTVVDNDSTAGNQDMLLLDAGIIYDQLWFKHIGSALEVSVIGTTDKLTISNWYGGATNHVERIQTADGHYLLDTQIEQLVQAMAGMTAPAAGETTLTSSQHQQLDTVFAASWQMA